MKRINLNLVIVIIVSMGVFTSCNKTPEEVLTKTCECLIDKDFKQMSDYIIVDSLPPLNDMEKDMFENIMNACYYKNIASATFTQCEVNDSIGEAKWETNLATVGGDMATDKGIMIKDANNEWKIAPFAGEDVSSEDSSIELLHNLRFALAKIMSLRGNGKYMYYMAGYYRNRYLDEDADKYLKNSAEVGYAPAQYDYAEKLHNNGNDSEAYEWMKKAVNQNYEKAQKRIAYYYSNGWGCPRNYDKSREIAEEFAAKGDAEMQTLLAWHYNTKNGLMAEELATAKKNAIEWYTKAAEQDYADAQVELGWHYDNKRQYSKAFMWYTRAAEQGNAAAQNNLGVLYARGRGTKRNIQQALYWYQKAAAQGNSLAERNYNMLSGRY